MAITPEMPHYLEAFLVEAGEELAQIEACLARLRKEGARLSVVEEALRAAANLKGAAATMGFRSIRDLAHAILDMLNAWRRGGVRDPEASLALLDRAHARLRDFLGMLAEGRGPEPSVIDLTLQLRALVTRETENPWPEAEPSSADRRDRGEDRFVIELGLEVPCPHPMGRFLVCQGYLLELGRVVASDPPPATNDPTDAEVELRFLLATSKDVAEIRPVLETIPHVRRVEVTPAPPEIDALPPAAARKRVKERLFQEWTIRVEAESLDELGEVMAELVQIRLAYRALEREIEHLNPGFSLRLARLGDRAEYSLRRLGEALAWFQQIPAEILLERLAGFARERARAMGKEMEAKFVGGEVAISIEQAEALFRPLQRLIEAMLEESALPPEARSAAGKKRANRFEFSVHRNDAKITLGVADDGRGMALEGAFCDGGRLADLRRAFEACGAMVEGESWPGQGTLFHIEFPPLGIHFEVLAVEVDRDLYALPLVEVVEARRAADEATVRIDGESYLPQEKEMIPVFDLPGLLGRPSGRRGGFWVFLCSQDRRYILRVPGVVGARRVSARPTPSGLKVPGLSGTCVDGEGRSYYLLSPTELIRSAAAIDVGRKGKIRGARA